MIEGVDTQLLNWRSALNAALSDVPKLYRESGAKSEIMKASDYVLTGGGKRLRGLLTLSVASDLGNGNQGMSGDGRWFSKALPVAAAVEALHAASLVHDDLPALDNDDMRRGRPSCHKAFDEATAILAADALVGAALLRVTSESRLSTDEQARISMLLSRAWVDLCVGQGLDIKGQKEKSLPSTTRTQEQKETIRLKTGALFGAASASGALCAGVRDSKIAEYWSWGVTVGECFQALDDLDDGERPQSDRSIVKDECQKTKEALASLDCRLGSGSTVAVLDSILGL